MFAYSQELIQPILIPCKTELAQLAQGRVASYDYQAFICLQDSPLYLTQDVIYASKLLLADG